MNTNMMFNLLPIFSLLIYLIPILFVVWFALKFLRIQERKNEILQSIADKMNK